GAGVVRLIGNGPDSFTNQVPATGDRWCAFARMGAFQGFVDLWVINVTKAASGTTTVACDGSDPSCIRLTTNLFVSSTASATSVDLTNSFFRGDTLIYQAETGPTYDATTRRFVGKFYAWRPAWEGGRPISSDSARSCAVHPKAQASICLENRTYLNPSGQACTFTDVTSDCHLLYDLHAGALPASAGAAPPAKIATLLLQSNQDTGA